MDKHVLIEALEAAGDYSRTVARNLALSNYTTCPDGVAPDDRYAMSLLSEALVYDATGHSVIGDRDCLNSAATWADIKSEARERTTRRAKITDTLVRFPREYRVRLIDEIAAGRAAQEAEALTKAVDVQIAALLADVRSDAFTSATA